jgi:hypothetical protein
LIETFVNRIDLSFPCSCDMQRLQHATKGSVLMCCKMISKDLPLYAAKGLPRICLYILQKDPPVHTAKELSCLC